MGKHNKKLDKKHYKLAKERREQNVRIKRHNTPQPNTRINQGPKSTIDIRID